MPGFVAGFGHGVYRDRDPPAEHLLDRVPSVAIDPARTQTVKALTDAAHPLGMPRPNADFGLDALTYALDMRRDAATAIFTIARIAGLIAHALEEYPCHQGIWPYTHGVRVANPLDSDQVVSAAQRVVSERGLAAVSVRSVATGLGVTPMALYRHIEDAQSLHARVVDACVIDLPVPVAGEDPLAAYREWAVGTRLALLAYPGLGHHLLLHWFELPAMLGIVEGLLELADRLGFEEFDQVGVANAVFSFVLARVDLEESVRAGDALERELDSIAWASERLPRLTTHLSEYERARVDEHFRFGLELMLDGITARKAQT